MDERERMHNAFRLAAFSFKVDAVTAEVTTALSEASIEYVLLKGPAIATWLYAGEEARIYGDTDLLIAKQDWSDATALLERLGFADDLGPLEHPRMESGSGYPWARDSDGSGVDLHYTLFGIGAPPEAVWNEIAGSAVHEKVSGVDVAMPSHPARLLHIALHAVQHASEPWAKPRKDLDRAVSKASKATWRESLELARRLDASETFTAGLRLSEAGEAMANDVGADAPKSVDASLRLNWVPMAEGFQELKQARGLRRKLTIVIRELFPNRAFMEWWSPTARRGGLGMLLAYLWRPFWLAWHAPAGFRAWRRAQR